MVAFTGLETPPPEATARLGLSKLVHLLDPTNAENLDMWGFSCESHQTLSHFSARLAKLLIMNELARPAGLEPATSWFVA